MGQADGNGIKIPSLPVPAGITCGGAAAADPGPLNTVATFNAGETITVQWVIHILHASAPGVQVALQYSAADSFSNNLLISGVDVQNNEITATSTGQVNVTLPANKTSSTAVLQWIWATTADGGYYVGCSDIAIVTSGGNSPPSGPQSSEAFAIRYSVGVLAILLAALLAAFLHE